jgi:hypothetical protein
MFTMSTVAPFAPRDAIDFITIYLGATLPFLCQACFACAFFAFAVRLSNISPLALGDFEEHVDESDEFTSRDG